MTVRKKTVRKLLTFSLISIFLLNQFLSSWPVLAVNEEASSSSQVATESAEQEIDLEAILNLNLEESSPSAEIATESAQATESATFCPLDLSILETTPSAQLQTLFTLLKPKNKKPTLVKGNLRGGEKLQIDLGDYQANEVKAFIYDSSGKEIELDVGQTEEGKIIFTFPNEFRPGKYHLKILDESSSEILIEQDFTWGVLAINTNKSIYLPGETAQLAMAVLNEEGRMVCDAKLTLKITNPQGETEELSTEKETIKVNPECQLHSYTEKPDYEAVYQTKEVGAYQMELLAETQNGSFTINDSFEVREQVDFDVERTGPTRIYPPAIYSVSFNVMANQDFEGVVEETVPSSFEILPLEEEEVLGETTLAEIAAEVENNTLTSYQRSYDKVEQQEKTKVISWYVSVKNGEKINLGYRFKAPDVSPQFYLLGPLKFINTNDQVAFQEVRQWQIAADASPAVYTSGSGQFTAEMTGSHTIILIGGGGGGAGGASSTNGRGGGGGGGGAACISVVSLTQGQNYNYSVGTLGSAGAVDGNGGNGIASTFVVGATTYSAGGGGGGKAPVVYTGGTAGTASNCDTNRTGGTGGTGTAVDSAGGGSAAGTTANGNPGTVPTGGAAVSLYGGKGGNGSTGNNVAGLTGEAYGGGGGGGTGKTGGGGTGYGGYIRIEWTLPTITVSGTSNVGEGTVVRVAVNGSLAGQTGAVTSGNWSITGVNQPSANNIMTVFATDGDGDIDNTLESSAIGKYSGSGNMTDMVLNINTLSVGGTGAQSISIPDLVTANYDADQDEDIMYDAETGSLLVQAAVNTYTAEKIDVLATDTLTVSGSETLTTHHLTITGNLTSTTTAAYNVAGIWTNNGTFTQASSTVTLNGSGSQTINGTTETAFYNLTVSNTAAIAVSTNMSIASSGTLNMNGANTTLNPDAGVVISGLGTLTGTGTVKVTRTSATADFSTQYSITNKTLTSLTVDYAGTGQVLSDLTYGKLTISTNAISTGANSATVGLGGAGSFTVGASGVFTPSSGTMTFNNNTSISNLGGGTLTFQNITIVPSATVTSSAAPFNIAGTLTVGSSGNFSPSALIAMTTANWAISNSGTLAFFSLTITETPSSQPTDSFSVQTLSVNSDKTLAPTDGTITISSGAGSINNSGTLTFNNLTLNGFVSTSSNFTVNGILNVVGGSFTTSGGSIITMATTSWAITNSGTLVFKNLTIAETPSVSGQPTSSFSVSGALTIDSGKTLAPTDGTITFTGGSIVNNGGATTNLVFNNLTVTGSPSTSSDFTVNKILNVNGGNLSPTGGTITMATTSWAITNTGTLVFKGLTISETPSSSGQTTASFLIAGTLTVNGGKNFSPDTGSTITMTGTVWGISNSGTLVFKGLTIDGTPSPQPTADFSISGALIINSGKTLAPTDGTITFTGGSIANNGGATTNLVFNNLTITGSPSTSSDFTVNKTLNISESGNLTPSGGIITMATTSWAITNSNILVFKGLTIAETPSSSGQPTADFSVSGALTVNNTKELAPTSGTITMSGVSSSIANSGTLVFNNLAVGSGASASTSDSFSIAANFTNDGAFNASNGTVTFSGGDGSTQQISGNSTFYNFTASTVGIGSTGRTLQFAGGSSINVGGTWAVTGDSGKVITLKSSNETNWTINPTAADVTYVDVYRSTRIGVSFCATYSSKDVYTLDWTVSDGDSCNQAPNSPSSLAQKKIDNTVLDTGDWTNENSVKFTATASDSDTSDTLSLCVEKDDINTAFGNTEDLCGVGVGYTAAGWYNASWSYRVKITVLASKVDADLTDYPVYVNLANLPAGFHSNVNQTDARDIRVTTSNGTIEVPREVVFYDSTTDTGELHFKGDIDSDVDTDFYIYYGNSGASDYARSNTYGLENVWTNNYKAVYHLQETANTDADGYKDSTSNVKHDTGVSMSESAGTGKLAGKATSLDGTDDNIGGPTLSSVQTTVEAWFDADDQTNAGIVSTERSGEYLDYFLGYSGSSFYWLQSGSGHTSWDTNVQIAPPSASTYHFVAGINDGSFGRLYLDGSEVGTADSTPTTTTGTLASRIGYGRVASTDVYFDGRVDEVRISSIGRVSTWISTEHNNQSSPSTFYTVGDENGTGGSVTVTVTITGITDATQYHWHARVKDAATTYSSWVAYGGNSDSTPGADRDFGIDTTAPTDGAVFDGTNTGVDIDFNGGSLSELSANWADINANVSGLDHYEYSIGTSVGGTEVGSWVSVGTGTSATATGLTLQTSVPYYFNVRGIDNATNTQTAISSEGQFVSPSLTFSVSPPTLTFDNLNVGNSYSDNKVTTLTTSTNAYGGYVIRSFVTDYLRSVGVGFTVPDFNGGTYASPGTWEVGNTGFGYTSSDTTIQEFGDKFGGGNLYAPFSQIGPGDIVADHTGNITGDPINEQFFITNKVKAGLTQPSSYYSTIAVYTATAQY